MLSSQFLDQILFLILPWFCLPPNRSALELNVDQVRTFAILDHVVMSLVDDHTMVTVVAAETARRFLLSLIAPDVCFRDVSNRAQMSH